MSKKRKLPKWSRRRKESDTGESSCEGWNWDAVALFIDGDPVTNRVAHKAAAGARVQVVQQIGFDRVRDGDLDELEQITCRLHELALGPPRKDEGT